MAQAMWNGEGEAVVGVLVVLGDHGGEALAEFYLGLKAGDAEVLGDVEVVEEHFLEGGLQFRGGVVAGAAEFLEHFLRGGFRVVGLAKPVEDQQELFLHLGGSAELVEGGGIEKLFQVFLGDFDALELAHALGRGHGVEDQVVVGRQVVSAAKQVDVGVVVVLDQKSHRSRRRGGTITRYPREQKNQISHQAKLFLNLIKESFEPNYPHKHLHPTTEIPPKSFSSQGGGKIPESGILEDCQKTVVVLHHHGQVGGTKDFGGTI